MWTVRAYLHARHGVIDPQCLAVSIAQIAHFSRQQSQRLTRFDFANTGEPVLPRKRINPNQLRDLSSKVGSGLSV